MYDDGNKGLKMGTNIKTTLFLCFASAYLHYTIEFGDNFDRGMNFP